ncbi:MAG: NAD-dependent epimerase/dehydratase family protein [Gemmatimonadetes bacterium]|nr:NAD-dependent epimerase/dehydratase family protein [Gemmatimonadota bacterium]
MRLLVLGGTRFVGRHVVEAALARGHTLTIFSRGQTHPELFAQVEKLRGDRAGDLSALRDRSWDAVVDTSGYVPRHVRATACLLTDATDHYTFISSIIAYADLNKPGLSEADALAHAKDPEAEEITPEAYGGLKAASEQAAAACLPGRLLAIRPTIIVGPHDYSDRFTYWCRRIAEGGEVLAPGGPERPVQLIDARDMAGWIIALAEERRTGAFNAVGPEHPLMFGELLEECRRVSRSDARFTWVSDDLLAASGVTFDNRQVPFWIPPGEADGFYRVDNRKAVGAGLRFRPLADTVRDTLEWDATRGEPALRAGLPPEREDALLRDWHTRAASGES